MHRVYKIIQTMNQCREVFTAARALAEKNPILTYIFVYYMHIR